MSYLPIVTVDEEGGLYRPARNLAAPIRVYPDRRVEDDILAKFGRPVFRERLSRKEFSRIRRVAKTNGAAPPRTEIVKRQGGEESSGGFMAFYSKPPFFMQVRANSADELVAKIAELDKRLPTDG